MKLFFFLMTEKVKNIIFFEIYENKIILKIRFLYNLFINSFKND